MAAKRACRPTEVPTPSRANATSSSGKAESPVATTVNTEPSAAITAPSARAGRRPSRSAKRASGMDAAAAPRVLATAAAPANASPAISAAMTAPMARVAPCPSPAST